MVPSSQWICCQLGAREHYAIPRALQARGALEKLITDIWIPPHHPLGMINPRLRERFEPAVPSKLVFSSNIRAVSFEMLSRFTKKEGWPLIMERNKWFQNFVLARLRRLPDSDPPRTVFAYSYAAREIFRYASQRGWRTVLGQIDPGVVEEEIVSAEMEREPWLNSQTQRAPEQYWIDWRAECAMADHIVVNSTWAFECVREAGVSPEKLHVLPLAFDAPKQGPEAKVYPERFNPQRPLRVLFLGQVNPRKGIAPLLKAADALRNEPVEFIIVGPIQIDVPPEAAANPRIHWIGSISRSRARSFYDQADVLILPTLSDGFALTQLEAFAGRLPVIASKNCGKVVQHGVNGLLLEEITPDGIESTLRFCLDNPAELGAFSKQAIVAEEFSLENLGQRLVSLPDKDL